MAERKGPGTPETNLSWRNGADEGRGSQSNDSSRRSVVFTKRRNRGRRSGSRRSRREGNSDGRMCFKIPTRKVGKVIGRRGLKVKELEDTTDTRIKVSREDRAGKVRVFVSGAPESQKKCKEMILELVHDERNESGSQERGAAGNRQNGRGHRDDFYDFDWDAIREKANKAEKNRLENLAPFKKYFYVEAQEVADMSEEYVRDLRRSLSNIVTSYPFGGSGKIPNPVETFDQAFYYYPRLLNQLRILDYKAPFPIQSQAWPVLLTGHDMIGIAQTGTGKTLAFLLPALVHIDGQDVPVSERDGPNVLIIAPTRELALQIDGEAKKFPYYGIRSVCLYGGGDRGEQIKDLQQGVNMVIGTPGRLNDCILAGALNLDTVTFLVLDEADHMLDLGFERQIRKLLLSLRPDKQTVMTSATWPYGIQMLAEKYMKEPIKILIGSKDLTAVHTVMQTVYILNEEQKYERLLEVIGSMSPSDKMIVFVGRRAVADSLSCDLALNRIECQSIHGDRVQSDREQALDDLRTGTVRILVATDVASRGLDIEDVTKVVNFDFPRNMEEYVHRVGRTGRAGKTGEAITFFTKADRSHATELISILENAGQVVPESLVEMSMDYEEDKARERFRRRGGRRRRR